MRADAFVSETPMETLVGRMLGQYQLEELLGSGGFGSVYRATHQVLGNSRAVKVLRPPDDADRRDSFKKLFVRDRFR